MLIHCTACKATFQFNHPAASTPERLRSLDGRINCRDCGIVLTSPPETIIVMIPVKPTKLAPVTPIKP